MVDSKGDASSEGGVTERCSTIKVRRQSVLPLGCSAPRLCGNVLIGVLTVGCRHSRESARLQRSWTSINLSGVLFE